MRGKEGGMGERGGRGSPHESCESCGKNSVLVQLISALCIPSGKPLRMLVYIQQIHGRNSHRAAYPTHLIRPYTLKCTIGLMTRHFLFVYEMRTYMYHSWPILYPTGSKPQE